MVNSLHTTTEHQIIMSWVESRNGTPAYLKISKEDPRKGALKIHFLDSEEEEEDSLRKLSWQEFFDYFEGANLAFSYESDMTSQYYAFVERE